MTRKDFITIADAIKESNVDEINKLEIATNIALALEERFPKFDLPRFMEHCVPDYEHYRY